MPYKFLPSESITTPPIEFAVACNRLIVLSALPLYPVLSVPILRPLPAIKDLPIFNALLSAQTASLLFHNKIYPFKPAEVGAYILKVAVESVVYN
nr:MAG TPA: hypothetical protein [Crassvirales sp.]